jgi:SLOG family YspA-like protein
MRVLVCGDRNWTDEDLILETLLHVEVREDKYIRVVIHGGCRGADILGGHAAKLMCGYAEPEEAVRANTPEVLVFKADWNKYGKAAGPIRNQQMLTEGKPNLVLAFHDDLECSKGTKDMVNRAKRAGIPVEVISHA